MSSVCKISQRRRQECSCSKQTSAQCSDGSGRAEEKREEANSLTAVFGGKDRESVIDALEQALAYVYVALDVLAHEREARTEGRIDEFAVWRKQAYAMLAECRKWTVGVMV